MNKFFGVGAQIKDWHSFTAPARLCYKLSGSEDEGVCLCVRVRVCFQKYMRESPLGIYCNEIQSQIRDQHMRCSRFKSPFLILAVNSRLLRAFLRDISVLLCVFSPILARIIDCLCVCFVLNALNLIMK